MSQQIITVSLPRRVSHESGKVTAIATLQPVTETGCSVKKPLPTLDDITTTQGVTDVRISTGFSLGRGQRSVSG
jgi:hypothetical protein